MVSMLDLDKIITLKSKPWLLTAGFDPVVMEKDIVEMAERIIQLENSMKEVRAHLLYGNNTPTRMHAIRIIDNALSVIDEALKND